MTPPLQGGYRWFDPSQAHLKNKKMFIKKIFQDKIDEAIHKQFIKFSKGNYDNRAVINVRKGKNIKITTTFELANDLVFFISNLAHKFEVSGDFLSKKMLADLFKKIEINTVIEKKKSGLFYKSSINQELTNEQIKELIKEAYYALLDCSAEGIELKIKKKLPRPSKGNKAKVKDKFCQLILDLKFWPQVREEFLWDIPRDIKIKKARSEHSFMIKEVVMPKETEGKSFEQIRQEAKKKGELTRKNIVNGEELVSKKDFLI